MLNLSEITQHRKSIRKQRRRLSHNQQSMAAQGLITQVMQHPQLKAAKHIGLYIDAFGEISTKRLMFQLFKQKKSLYLPVVCNMNQHLQWKQISLQQLRNQRFALHPLGMRQPMCTRGKKITYLDMVMMPLVLFDAQGHRVGMGGGFYDRTLAQHPYQPYRLGLAHDFQYVQQGLVQQAWDQKLHGLCTATKTWHF